MKYRKKIIFVNPPLTPDQRYGLLSQAGAVEPHFGLTYLAAVTRKMGIQSSILDAEALGLDLEKILDHITKERPEFLGITFTTISTGSASRLASLVKEKVRGITVIVGGCHLSSLPDETLGDNPAFDIGIIGEGESSIEELLNVLIDGGDLSKVMGIVFRDNGRVTINPRRQRIKDLDQLPMPAFDLLPDLKKYYHSVTQSIRYLPTTSLVTSRGCIGRCAFCDRKTFGNETRMHGAPYVVEMIELLKSKYHIRGIFFEDDNFFLSAKRLSQIADLLKKRRIHIPWTALSRIDTITAEKLEIAKSCGCWQILYGIESGSQEILDFYHKGITIDQIKRAIHLTRSYGIYAKGFFVCGNPLETEETLEQTKDFIMRLGLDDISLTFFTPYPGSDIWRDIDKFGRCVKEYDKLSCFNIVFLPSGISRSRLMRWQLELFRKFYRRPRIFYSYLTRLRSLGQIRELYKSWRALSKYTKGSGLEKELVINADDFGLCEGINRGVLKGIKHGSLNSVSLISAGYAFKSAVDIIRENPDIRVGIHLSFLQPEENPPVFLRRYFLGKIKSEEIIKEFRRQIDKLKKEGVVISHLDSHQHLHLLPGVFKISLRLCKEYKIPHMRLPCVPLNRRFFLRKAKFNRKLFQILINMLCVIYRPILKKNQIHYYRYSFGFLESGRLDKKEISELVLGLKDEQYELICHLAEEDGELKKLIGHWGYHWNQELEALISQ